MPRKTRRNTRGAIVSSAWKLFYEQGYEHTTVEDILALAGTSKGTFYHYFEGKDALVGTLSVLFDEKYAALMPTLPEDMDALETLALLNRELFAMIDASIPLDLLARLLSTQLTVRGEKHLLDRDRLYFRLLREIVSRGQAHEHPGAHVAGAGGKGGDPGAHLPSAEEVFLFTAVFALEEEADADPQHKQQIDDEYDAFDCEHGSLSSRIMQTS